MPSGRPESDIADLKVAPYSAYGGELRELVDLVRSSETLSGGALAERTRSALDGGSSHALRSLVSRHTRRRTGAFFTDHALAELTWKQISAGVTRDTTILDPTCGSGSLLLPPLRSLVSAGADAAELERQLSGFDLQEEFVAVAQERLKLALLTDARPKESAGCHPRMQFGSVQVGNVLSQPASAFASSRVVLNPPFGSVEAPGWVKWGAGSVNQAAVITDWVLARMAPGARLAAILPDVLRSGTRYRRWREAMAALASIDSLNIWGRFDHDTDVDVFVVSMTRHGQSRHGAQVGDLQGAGLWIPGAPISPAPGASGPGKIADGFTVDVGTVVNYRDPRSGPQRAYLTARGLPSGGVVSRITTHRRFEGRCHQPPFVAVRRTSAPTDEPRARATIVVGKRLVAVDNHLLVLTPTSAAVSLGDCQRVVHELHAEQSSNWLNERFRCRHLPVSAITDLPRPNVA